MGMVLTTSLYDGEKADWIFDPSVEPGDELMIDGAASTICDVLEALGLETNCEPDPTWSLEMVKPRLTEALETADPGDDYLVPRLTRLSAAIAAGEARGARYLMAS